MPFGYAGRVLHVDLTNSKLEIEQPPEAFYRKYMGGSGLALDYLLRLIPPKADPLGPENVLVLSVGVLTGAPIGGLSRVMANAKSPLTGGIGDSQGGGYWPAEFRFSGFDAIVISGKAPRPVYLWLHDGEYELRDAGNAWGKVTGEAEQILRDEVGDPRAQVLQIGPAGEKRARIACIVNMSTRACGRTGMGAVMGSKNLKAVVVRGRARPELADPDKLKELAQWGRENLEDSGVWGLRLNGTAGGIDALQREGALPTRNWTSGVFEDWTKIWGQTMTDTILKENDTCYACNVRCKRVVETKDTWAVDPLYGGPEYETLAALGSYCGVGDLAAIAKANELCNKYGLDTISCGATVAFAMDCYEHGILSAADTDGLELRFGNAEAMVKTVEMIGTRTGLGQVLAEGSARAAKRFGKGSENLVVTGHNQEFPAHEPRAKRSLALIYAVNPFGADHMSHEHDFGYRPTAGQENKDNLGMIGCLEPQHARSLGPAKVRFALQTEYIYSALDCLGTCMFVWGPTWQLYHLDQLVECVRAVTGWKTSLWELMTVGERRLNLLRAYNAREGMTSADDQLPARMFTPAVGGATDGVAVDRAEWEEAKRTYYKLAGWTEDGVPTESKLAELNLEWVAELL